MTHKYESRAEFEERLDEMIKTGLLKAQYKSLLLEIDELGTKACAARLISGLGWGVDANNFILDEYEITDKDGNPIYLSLAETRDYLKKLIADSEQVNE
ncbi:MAG: hypothetical protein KME32_35455 [Mojavia pulchra JT2-VF2]|jgi:hypothetical protein|uniref:Uncharacterized protein n=1 Tax=Mojavia pulchra JT2-VF2 TaxID=287848 RepID=A0A951Q806_9NOST|nr:hypothetical protein [Mojavia pulchra JT2-VF2]